MRVRRTPHLVVYWRDGSLVLENYLTGMQVEAVPDAMQLLALLGSWRDPASLAGALPEYSSSSITRTLDALARSTIVEREGPGSASRRASRGDAAWSAWHPAAGLLHFSSKDLAYQDFPSAQRALRAQAKRRPRPPAVKRYPDAAQVRLTAPQLGEFPRVLLDRRTWRRFSARPVTLAAVSTLLGLSSRVQYWVAVPGVGRLPMKTYPSGGAQHPLEVYVLARNVEGLAPGLYHYAADAHRLERLRAGATSRQLRNYLPGQPWFGAASVLLIVTAVFPRMQWKYAFARAYRAVLTESGHLCQNLCLAATWLGLAPFCTMALADSRIERDLRIDGVGESVLYVAGVGSKPDGADWAPWPTNRRLVRTPNKLR